jgi:hypothetical protein
MIAIKEKKRASPVMQKCRHHLLLLLLLLLLAALVVLFRDHKLMTLERKHIQSMMPAATVVQSRALSDAGHAGST